MNYILLKDYISGKAKVTNQKLFVGKTRKSYLIGPLINEKFNSDSFYKRIISSTICDKRTYRRILKFKTQKLVDKYYDMLSDNEMLEVFKGDKIVHHKIIKVVGVNNE